MLSRSCVGCSKPIGVMVPGSPGSFTMKTGLLTSWHVPQNALSRWYGEVMIGIRFPNWSTPW